MDEGDAVAPIVGHGDDRLDAYDLREVVVEQSGVAQQAVAPGAGLAGKAVAGEVEHAHPVARAQPLGDLEPIDAARREAVYEHHGPGAWVAELDVKDLHGWRVLAGRGPREMSSPGAPTIGAGA